MTCNLKIVCYRRCANRRTGWAPTNCCSPSPTCCSPFSAACYWLETPHYNTFQNARQLCTPVDVALLRGAACKGGWRGRQYGVRRQGGREQLRRGWSGVEIPLKSWSLLYVNYVVSSRFILRTKESTVLLGNPEVGHSTEQVKSITHLQNRDS